ncbi:MAG: hypothetical protein ACLP19_28530 [Xanthobacteraceae bacterium]
MELSGVQKSQISGAKGARRHDRKYRSYEQFRVPAAARKNWLKHGRKPDHVANDKAINGEDRQGGGERSDARVIAMAPRNKFMHRDGAVVTECTLEKL